MFYSGRADGASSGRRDGGQKIFRLRESPDTPREMAVRYGLAKDCLGDRETFRKNSPKNLLRGVDSARMVPYNCAPTLDVSERGRARRGGEMGLTQPVKRPILMSPTREEAL